MRRAKEVERNLADFVMDRASLRHDRALELLNQSPLARFADLEEYVRDALDYQGGYLAGHSEGGQVITLSGPLADRLRTRARDIRGSFDPGTALAMEEIDFFAFGHEIVESLIDVSLDAHASTGVRKDPQLGSDVAVEIYYQLESIGLRPHGKFLRHRVGHDLVPASEALEAVPDMRPCDGVPVPTWGADAVAASRDRMREEHAEELRRVRAEDEEVKKERVARAERLLDYRRIRLERAISEDQDWLQEHRGSADSDILRVIPAREGKVRKNQERLAALIEEHQGVLSTIESSQRSLTVRIVAAGLVVGA